MGMNIKEVIKNIDLDFLYNLYKNQLLSFASCMFEYSGFPETVDTWELEKYMLEIGYCGLANVTKNGVESGLYVVNGSMSGVTPYEDRFMDFIYTNPYFDCKTYKINEDLCLFKNTHNYNKLSDEIAHYSLQLADIAISLSMCIVNQRENDVFSVENESQKNSVNNFYEQIRLGNYAVLDGNDIISTIKNIAVKNSSNNQTIASLIQAQNNVYRQFFRLLGVNTAKDKSQAILSDETMSDIMGLKANIYPMLKSREECVKRFNDMFGYNVTVKLNNFVYNYLDEKVIKESEEKNNE